MNSIFKRSLILLALAAGTAANAQVGVSVGISQPGVYGRINIGDFPRPEVVMAQPVVVVPQPHVETRQPIYLYVPQEHQQNWRRYCGRYGACGQPVYFVKETWVRERYAQDYPDWDHGRGIGRGRSRGDREDRVEHRGHDDDRGRDYRDDGSRGGDRRGRDDDRGGDGHGKH